MVSHACYKHENSLNGRYDVYNFTLCAYVSEALPKTATESVLAVVTENPKIFFKAPNNVGHPMSTGNSRGKNSSFINKTWTTHAHTNKDLFVAGYGVKTYSTMQFRSLSEAALSETAAIAKPSQRTKDECHHGFASCRPLYAALYVGCQ
jgi:hypothetical protein